MKTNSYSNTSNMQSIRKRVLNSWVENPHIAAKKMCSLLKLDYAKKGGYVNKLLSEFRCYYDSGSPLRAQVPHKRVFAWERVDDSRTRAVECGWAKTTNHNGMLVFRDGSGSVHWYKGGLVRLYLRGPAQLARAKELFSRAFSWFSVEQLCAFLDVPLREESHHWVFELNRSVPRFDIRKFRRSHGLRIFADRSHPTAVEVEETQPFWLGELREVTELLRLGIEEHLELIKGWPREARACQISWLRCYHCKLPEKRERRI